jgi:adenylate cyclase
MGVQGLQAGDNDIESLLGSLEGRARQERAELIHWLLSRDVTVDEIRTATSPMLLAARHLVGGDDRYVSARETSSKHGIELELLQRIQNAMGMPTVDDPDASVHMSADAEAAARVQRFVDLGLDTEQIIGAIRILSEGLSRAAEVMRSTAFAAVLEPGATELEIARRYEASVSRIAPSLGPLIEDMMFFQLRHMMMETEAVTASERADGMPLPGARSVSVAFADLVGFTRLGESVPPEELEGLARNLSDIAWQVASPPVRMIKTIGDAVMFVSPDPAALLETVLNLMDATEANGDLPRLKVGMTVGQAVSRAGDWFGSPVNLASRVTSISMPGAVLVAQPARDAIGKDPRFTWSDAGARKLKGIEHDVRLSRARRAVNP